MKFDNNTLREAVKKWFTNRNETELEYGHISMWNTSEVTDMSGLFENRTTFNENISEWNVSMVANMKNMFRGASAFNYDVSGWNFTSLTNIACMFCGATSYEYNFDYVRFKSHVNIANMFDDDDAYVTFIRKPAPKPEDVPLPHSPRLTPRVDILNKKAFHKGALIEIEEFETRVIFNVVLLKLRGPILENDETAIRCTISKDACVPYRQWYTWFYSKRSAIKTREDEAIRVASILFPSDENVAAVTGTPTTVEDFDFDPVNKDA